MQSILLLFTDIGRGIAKGHLFPITFLCHPIKITYVDMIDVTAAT